MNGLGIVRFLLKWGVIGAGTTIGVAVIVFFILTHFVKPDRPELVRAQAPTVEQQGPVGGRQFDFQVPDSRVPRTPAAEDAAPPITLIPERQVNPVAPVAAPSADERAFASLVRGFLPGYETFTPGESADEYAGSFARFVVPDRLSSVASRGDSHAPPEIGLCDTCTTGSTFTDSIDPGLYVVVRRFSTGSAYLTTQGIVRYSGGGAVAGRSYRRSYALLLRHVNGRWLVNRVASETLQAER